MMGQQGLFRAMAPPIRLTITPNAHAAGSGRNDRDRRPTGGFDPGSL